MYLELATLLGRISLARTHENLGHCYEILRNFDKAIDHYQKVSRGIGWSHYVFCLVQCLKAAVATKNRLLEAQTFCYIGNCLKATLQPEKAIECYKRVRISSHTNHYLLR